MHESPSKASILLPTILLGLVNSVDMTTARNRVSQASGQNSFVYLTCHWRRKKKQARTENMSASVGTWGLCA